MTDDDTEGLTQRSFFAHQYMRFSIFRIGVWPTLLSERGHAYLQGMWQRSAEGVEVPGRVEPVGLGLEPVQQSGEWYLRPIRFPEPQRAPEAYFGVIAVKPGRKRWLTKAAPPVIRYFTLELGLELPEAHWPTVLCEWTLEVHLNYGMGPEARLPDFIAAVESHLDNRSTPEAFSIFPFRKREEREDA
jgi:hypothetical protein